MGNNESFSIPDEDLHLIRSFIKDYSKEKGISKSQVAVIALKQLIKAEEKKKMIEQYGGLSPADAFCGMGNDDKDDNVEEELFGFLPKMHEPLTKEHLKKLVTEEQVLILHNTLLNNSIMVREYFDIETRRDSNWNIIEQTVRKPATLSREKKESELELLKQKLALTPEEKQKQQELVNNIFLNGSFEQVSQIAPHIREEDLNALRKQKEQERWRFESMARDFIIKNRSDNSSRAAAIEKSGK